MRAGRSLWSVGRAGIAIGAVAGVTAGLMAACELAELPAATGSGVCDAPLTHLALPDELEETSGIAASRVHPGVYWSHNDSGGDPIVFAVDSAGRILARVRVTGATNRDWEDIATGPCEGLDDEAMCVFIGEIGDNSERHDRVVLYRFPEPDPATDSATAPVAVIGARYPDGPRDAEAVYVTTRGIHVINKGRSGAVELFRLSPPYDTAQTGRFQRVQQIAPPPTSVSAQVTAAAANPAGDRVVVRAYSGLRFFRVDGDTLAPWGRPADLVVPEQMQGEAVDWIDDQRFILTSESRRSRPASIATVRCDPERPAEDERGTDEAGAAADDSAGSPT